MDGGRFEMPRSAERDGAPTRGTGPLLLLVDYPGRRDGARIDDLHLEDHGFSLCDMLCSPPRDVSPASYVSAVLERAPAYRAVRAVLSYCGSTGVAQGVAALAAARQATPPSFVSFDAVPGAWSSVVNAYRAAHAQLPGRHRIPAAWRTADVDTMPATLAAMRRTLRERAASSLVRQHAPGEAQVLADQFVDQHMRWIEHLAASAVGYARAWGGAMLQVASSGHEVLADWPGAATIRVRRFQLTRDELLRQAAVAAEVAMWLESGPPAGRVAAG